MFGINPFWDRLLVIKVVCGGFCIALLTP
ncbi:DUF3265 domain-containing protein (plasmid) [Vibrio campbellii]|nr:DUF3265 domain-containing protein [Vibrio campbellii]